MKIMEKCTADKLLEEELRKSNERNRELNGLIQSSFDGIVITDAKGKVLMVNKSWERISGMKIADLLGEYISESVKKGVISVQLTPDVVSKREPVTVLQTTKTGKRLLITGSPVFDENGRVIRVITNVRDVTELNNMEKDLVRSHQIIERYRKIFYGKNRESSIVCESPEFQKVLNIAKAVASKDSTILLLGETGVGKEVVAEYIVANSKRKDGYFIRVNCGGIPENLLESEFFGYVEGAFTGASKKGKMGIFELADRGTIFLDEIGELPRHLQSSLLRVLQNHEVTRLGDATPRKVNVRVIAATNRDLGKMIQDGTFRSDLFYRLNVVSIHIPNLRARKEDIPGLIQYTLEMLNEKYAESKNISSEFLQYICERDWPGNVRELQNFIEKHFVITESDLIDPPNPSFFNSQGESSGLGPAIVVNEIIPLKDAVAAVERELILKAFQIGKTTYKAARILGISQSTAFRKYRDIIKDRPPHPGGE